MKVLTSMVQVKDDAGKESDIKCGLNADNVISWYEDGDGTTVVDTIKGTLSVNEDFNSFNVKMMKAK